MKDFINFILSDTVYMIISVVIMFLIVALFILIVKLLREINMSNKVNKQQSEINNHRENVEPSFSKSDFVNRSTNEDNFKAESIGNNDPGLNVNAEEIPVLRPEVKAEIMSSIQSNNEDCKTQLLNVGIPSDGLEATQLLSNSNLATLVYQAGQQIKEFAITGYITNVGRDPEDCDIVISSDKYIGRNHARIYFKNNRFYLTDLNSTNGTFINGERIQGEKQINDEDIIKFATTELRFKIC